MRVEMNTVGVAVCGVGNCAAALTAGAYHYSQGDYAGSAEGLITGDIGPYGPDSIRIVAAFDVDPRKVGQPLAEAIYAIPDIQDQWLCELGPYGDGPEVKPGMLLDGIGRSYAESVPRTVEGSFESVCEELSRSGTDVLVNYLPVGSQFATEMYAKAALEVGCAFVNAIPVFIARTPEWRQAFDDAGLPLIGDDVKSQLGATYTHRALVQAFRDRGISLDETYQLNVGGNMDFKNMRDEERLKTKRVSKLQSVMDVAGDAVSSYGEPSRVYVGPSDHISFLGDRKLAFIRVEGQGFLGNPISIEARFECYDSPNSGGVIFDAVRWAKLALDAGYGGALTDPSAFLMKAPPTPLDDAAAIAGLRGLEHALSMMVTEKTPRPDPVG